MPRPSLPSSRILAFTLPATGHDVDMSGEVSGGVVEVSGLAVPWNVPASRFGVPVVFTRETTSVPEDLSTVKFLIGHDDDRPAGYGTAATFTDDGLRMTFAVDSSHPRAAELLREIDLRWRDGLSVGLEMDDETVDAIWEAMWTEDPEPVPLAGTVREVSAVAIPQFNAARVGAAAVPPAPVIPLARFAAQPLEEGSPMTTTTAAPAAAAPDTATTGTGADTGTAPAAFTFSPAELAAELAPFLGATTAAASPLARFAGAGEFIMAAREGRLTEDERAAFALADQITTNNPGVMQPSWVGEIVGILSRGRPTVTAFGGPSGAGDSGMDLHWPYYDGGFSDLVAVQATEKTEVHTRRVDIKDASAGLETYAGASDISYQLLRRSSPSYREAYSRILSIGYAVTTDAAFATQVLAQATPATGGVWTPAEDLDALLEVLFEASAQVDDAVGTPADVVLASPDMFIRAGVLAGLLPTVGVPNAGAGATASALRVNVSGLEIIKDRSLPPGTLLVAASTAATWAEDGPFPVEADDVAKLGLDVGIWGMGVGRVTVPGGIVAAGDDGVPAGARSSSSSSSSATDDGPVRGRRRDGSSS